jgi:hypothetical protein
LQVAVSVIGSRQYQHPQLHVDFHSLREQFLPFEPATPLVQEDQVKRSVPKAFHSLSEGRTGAHLAAQVLEYGSVVEEILRIFVDQKDSGLVSRYQYVCQPLARG